MKPPVKKAAEPPKKTERAPNYGTPGEKEAHEKLDPRHHHGGRTETPDTDVNPADDLHVKERDRSPVTRRNPPAKRRR